MNTVLGAAKKALAIVALAGMTLGSSIALADAEINDLLQVGENQFEDFDAERVVAADGSIKTSGDFAVGDTIEAILRFTNVNGGVISDNIGFGAPYQLNAYSELVIVDIIDIETTALGDVGTLIFGPSGNLQTANSLADIYERTSVAQPSLDVTIDPDLAIADVQSQTFVASLGLAGSDDFWVARTLLDIGLAASQIAGAPQAANGTFGLTVVANPGALPIETDGIQSGTNGLFYDVVGSASAYVLDTNADEGWLVSSNTEARFNVVPEPSTLALLSFGLLGAAAMRRRRS